MPFVKGHPKYGGRRPGSGNRSTASVKAALEEAFEKLGGVGSLVDWGRDNLTEFYRLWSKMLPRDMNVNLADAAGTIGAEVRARLDEVDGIGHGQSGEVGGGHVADVADAAAPETDQPLPS